MTKRFFIYILLSVLLIANSGHSKSTHPLDLSLSKEIEHSIMAGLNWLVYQQEENGSWQNYPAITALVLSSFLRAHPNISTEDEIIAAGFDYLKSCVRSDGGIYVEHMPTYNTAISLTAFKDAADPDFHDIIINAEKFLMGMQFGEQHDQTTDSLHYGGVGYGEKDRPDLSNLQWAVEAIAMDDIDTRDPEMIYSDEELERMGRKKLFYDRALTFLARVQNLENVNPEGYSANDGGFMYKPGSSKLGGSRSYGSMTYAGLKSMIYARVDKDDERVQAAFEWISQYFTVETTPFMRDQGLYYYYQTMAKALHAFGEEVIVDTLNTSHLWREALADQLIKTQHADGYWINENGRWWENNPVLVTAYSLLALQEAAGLPDRTTIMNRRRMQGMGRF